MTDSQASTSQKDTPTDSPHSDTATSASVDATPPEDLAQRMFDVLPIGTVVVDPSGKIVFANDRASETLGLTAKEIANRTYDHENWNTYYDDGTPVPVSENPVTHVLETGEPVFGFEHWIEQPEGPDRWLSTSTSPVFDETGEIEYVVVAFEDLTELKRREEQLTSDRVRQVVFRANRSAVPPSLRVEAGEISIDIDSVVSLPDETTVQHMGTADLAASEFVTAIEEVDHFHDVRLVSSIDGYTRLEAHAEPGTVSQVFSLLGGRPRKIHVASDEVRFCGELPGDIDQRLAAEGIREFHTGVELLSQELVYSPHLLYDIVADALTDRQLATLDAAYFGGYFETPRASTGNELADRFGVTRQTCNQHLRKAQQTVFQHLFEKSGESVR